MVKNRKRTKSFSQRLENNREERKTLESKELLTFSFKDLDETQPKDKPQSIASWAQAGLLTPFLEKLRALSKLTRNEAENQKLIKIYGDFPESKVTKFFYPKHVKENITWGVVKNIGGQKGVVAGYIVENTFYIVFLDKEHQFWISKKKHT